MIFARLNTFFQGLLPQKFLSSTAGKLATLKNKPFSKAWIRFWWARYCGRYGEPTIDASGFENFNDFFTRELTADVPELAANELASPAEGLILDSGLIKPDLSIQVKYDMIDIQELVGSERAKLYANGSYSVIYLAPGDYHCVHSAQAGELSAINRHPGKLFSVNPSTLATRKQLLSRNERVAMHFAQDKEDGNGYCAIVMVGALIVGGMHTIFDETSDIKTSDIKTVEKGQKIGEFYVGSTVVVLHSKPLKQRTYGRIQVGWKLGEWAPEAN